LTFGPPGSSEDPEIDIASSISFSPGNTPIQHNPHDLCDIITELLYGCFHRLVILWLWNPENWIVWDRESTPVNLNEALVTFRRFEN